MGFPLTCHCFLPIFAFHRWPVHLVSLDAWHTSCEGVNMEDHRRPYKLCRAPNCDRPARTREYCPRHYQQVRKYGRLTPEREQSRNPPVCVVEGCPNEAIAKGYCWKHYLQIRRHGRLTPEREHGRELPLPAAVEPYSRRGNRAAECVVEGCDGKYYARGYCRRHYQRWWYTQRKNSVRHKAR
jgi:hypothetical protein